MAITSAIMQMRRGLEADFDPDKMRPGEWAVSTDKQYVRMCFSVGVCVRMATYDAFEEDMAQIEEILSTCETIEEAVSKINTEVSANAQAVAEYTEQAKKYRDEAKAFRDEAEQFAPDGYVELKETVASNTAKIDTIIEKAELNIKNSASGENIHLTDSASSKVVEFGLYGKAEQKQYSGKNLLENTATSQTVNGVTFTVNEDKSITANGTATSGVYLPVGKFVPEAGTSYIVSDGQNNANYYVYATGVDGGSGWHSNTTITPQTENQITCTLYVKSGVPVNNVTFKPMIRLASITDSTYEPYVGGIASPNPDYPQEITVAGESGSVEVVSCGKNLLNQESFRLTNDGTNRTKNLEFNLLPDRYYFSCKWQGTASSVGVQIYNEKWQILSTTLTSGEPIEFYSESLNISRIYIFVPSGDSSGSYADITDIMIMKKESGVDTSYQPYTETLSTIPTINGLCGIKVSSGGNYTDENGQQWICDEIVKYADGSGKRIQRIGKVVFDGSDDEVIRSSGVNNHGYYSYELLIANCISTKEVPASYSTHFCYKALWQSDTEIFYNADGYVVVLSRFETIDLLREFLNANPVTFIVPITTIITDLSAEEIAEIEKLHTFYPVTNISNDADCGMSITYMADAKRYIDQRLALIESAMLNNI